MSKTKNLDALIRIEDAIKMLCRKTCHPGVFCPDGYCVEVWDAFKDVERVDAAPCDVCRYAPPSSGDGKPCTICPAEGKDGDHHG